MAGWLLVNPRSGQGSNVDELRSAAEALGVEIHVLAPGEEASDLAREAQADILGAAGGDGTMGAVAGAAIERGLPFVCVPFGTRNHFARDLGLDRSDFAAALAGFDGGEEHRVDVARVNGTVFLNNVSIGAYAVLVHHGWRRAVDSLRLRHRLTVNGRTLRTRVLLVGNNSYSLTGKREQLDEGLLHVYTAGGELLTDTRVVVGFRSARVRTAVDGEPRVLTTPVEIDVVPGALRVLLPRRPVS